MSRWLSRTEELPPGTMLHGRYEIRYVVGSGGMGIVYRTWDTVQGTDTAVKELYPETCCKRGIDGKSVELFSKNAILQYQDWKKHFLLEADTMSGFSDCPNLLASTDFFEENNTYYYVAEILDGMALNAYLDSREKPLAQEEASHIAVNVMDALAYLHKRRLIHRDICCNNIYLMTSGTIKVIDYGAMVDMDGQDRPSIILRPGYAPPEQYTSNSELGSWTDVYAAGAVLYEMVTKSKVYESVKRLEEDMLVPPVMANSQLTVQFSNIIMKALSLDSRKRFQTAEEFKESLERSVEKKNEEVFDKQAGKRKVKRVICLLVGLVGLVLGCIVGLVLVNG